MTCIVFVYATELLIQAPASSRTGDLKPRLAVETQLVLKHGQLDIPIYGTNIHCKMHLYFVLLKNIVP